MLVDLILLLVGSEGIPSPPVQKVLKIPSLPTKQQRESDSSTIIYANANVQEKIDAEEKSVDNLSPLTPKQSPLAKERFESGYKNTLAAFKEFDVAPVPQSRTIPPKTADQSKPLRTSKPASRTISASRSFDDQHDLAKPTPPAKPILGEKPLLSEKPVKVLPAPRPNVPSKPVIGRKKETGSSPVKGHSAGLKRRPTSEPVNGNAEDQGKVRHLGTAQFQHAKNLVQATLITKPEGDCSRDSEAKKSKEQKESKGAIRPVSAPPKPPVAVIKPITKLIQPYEEVVLVEPVKGFQYQIQPVSMVKLQSHKDKVNAKTPIKYESTQSQAQRRKTVDLSRPQHSLPENGDSDYSYATTPVSVIEKLKEAQSKPQLKTGVALAYATSYGDATEDGNPKDPTGSRKSSDYSYVSDVIIPVTPGNSKENLRRLSSDRIASVKATAYEVIEVGGLPCQRSPDVAGQEETPVFDKNLEAKGKMLLQVTIISVLSVQATPLAGQSFWISVWITHSVRQSIPPSIPLLPAGLYDSMTPIQVIYLVTQDQVTIWLGLKFCDLDSKANWPVQY